VDVKQLLAIVVVLSVTSRAQAQSLNDPNLRVQSYVSGFDQPTGAVFLNDQGDLLVTQKDDGRVILVRNRQIAGTALDLPVANASERGLLSIALSPSFASDNLVYLYHSAAGSDGGAPISNKVSRYRLDGDQLVFDRKILDLPPGPGPNHDGGKIMFDAKGKLFVVIGDLNRDERTQNIETSPATTRSGAILRINPTGTGIATNPFNAQQDVGRTRGPEADIYAYGIRNSFGIAFDPVTGNLWDTENGPDRMDEINLVRPGFNSGWKDVMGPSSITPVEPGSLVQLGDAAHYSDPELSWSAPVAPTDLHFYESGKLGAEYTNDLFVGDVNTGSLYHFDLTSRRRSLRLTGPLEDYLVNNEGNLVDEIGDNVLGEGFGVISDIFSGPGGMFVLSLSDGRLLRIQQNPDAGADVMAMLSGGAVVMLPEPGSISIIVLFTVAWASRPCARRYSGKCMGETPMPRYDSRRE
jgi:glucose/arabinose dehydrogenase